MTDFTTTTKKWFY